LVSLLTPIRKYISLEPTLFEAIKSDHSPTLEIMRLLLRPRADTNICVRNANRLEFALCQAIKLVDEPKVRLLLEVGAQTTGDLSATSPMQATV
jgi:hypothetical protein